MSASDPVRYHSTIFLHQTAQNQTKTLIPVYIATILIRNSHFQKVIRQSFKSSTAKSCHRVLVSKSAIWAKIHPFRLSCVGAYWCHLSCISPTYWNLASISNHGL